MQVTSIKLSEILSFVKRNSISPAKDAVAAYISVPPY